MYQQATCLFLLIAGFHLSASQNASVCLAPDMPDADFENLQRIARVAVFSYLAGEDGVPEFDGETSKQVLTESNIDFIKDFMTGLDPQQMKESAYAQVLENGQVPSGRVQSVGIDYAIEKKAREVIRELKGPIKLALDVLRDHPEFKYNQEQFARTLHDKLNSVGSDVYADDISIDDSEDLDDPYIQCRADLNYLYDPILQTLGCLIREIINGIISGLIPCEGLEGVEITLPSPLPPLKVKVDIPGLCFNVTAPDRPIPGVAGTCEYISFLLPI